MFRTMYILKSVRRWFITIRKTIKNISDWMCDIRWNAKKSEGMYERSYISRLNNLPHTSRERSTIIRCLRNSSVSFSLERCPSQQDQISMEILSISISTRKTDITLQSLWSHSDNRSHVSSLSIRCELGIWWGYLPKGKSIWPAVDLDLCGIS